MANNQNHQLNTDQIRELLSPYLDGEVTGVERVQVEQALAASPELQRELETLRRSIALVAALPVVAAPRPFTLSEAQVKPAKPASRGFLGLPGWFRGVAALAATLLCVLAAGGLFWNMQFGGSSQPAAEIASAPTVPVEAPAAAQAPVQEEADQSQSVAREEAPQTAAKATEEVQVEAVEAQPPAPTAAPAEDTMLAAPAEPPAATQQAAPADESMALESQAITQAYEAAPAEQPAADTATTAVTATPPPPAAAVLPELSATPSPMPSVAALAAPAQEKAAANGEAEAGQMAAESAPVPPEAPVQENAAGIAPAQTDQLTAESAPASEPAQLEQAQAAPTATPLPQPSATLVAVLTLPVPETPLVTPTPTPLVEGGSINWGLTIVLAVAGLLIIVGLIIWLINRSQK